jgi:hypothetical protein
MMSASHQHYPVGVVVERRKGVTQWQEYVFTPVAVLPDVPDLSDWASLGLTPDGERFLAGRAMLEFHRNETTQYRDNLTSGAPKCWVVLRLSGVPEPPYEVAAVTVDPAEGEAFTEIANGDIVDVVPMPRPIAEALHAFIEEHHVERVFLKRKRDRAQPEDLARGRSRDSGYDPDGIF